MDSIPDTIKHGTTVPLAGVLVPVLLSGFMSLQAQFFYSHDEFCMGADMSYVNHIQDKGAEWRENGLLADPYELFARHGGNCARFRLWHDPQHTLQVYIDAGEPATRLYHDFYDVTEAIGRAKAEGLAVCLDFHYSDFWADPGRQYIPAAWESLDFNELEDSIYEYTYNTLTALDAAGFMPEYVQVGNEINNGFVHPFGVKEGSGTKLAVLLNAAIRGVRDAVSGSSIDPRIIIHIAQPENVDRWFGDMVPAGVTDFDIIGFSYYAGWSDVPLHEVGSYVSLWREKYGKEVMCMETSYLKELRGSTPGQDELAQMEEDFYPSVAAQENYFISLATQIIEGGGRGLFPWEPFWVQGQRLVSAWGGVGTHRGNSSYYEYSQGNEVQASIDWMMQAYQGISGTPVQRDSIQVSILLYVPDSLSTGEQCYLEGSFTGQEKVRMTRLSDTGWSYSLNLPHQTFHLFRFYQGQARDSLPDNYRIGDSYDRALSVPDSQAVFQFTWHGGPPARAPDSVNVTFQVDMRGEEVDAEGVYIYGNFLDQWGPRMPMDRICDSVWTATIRLKAGTEYWFRFFNGYQWEDSEVPPSQCRYGDKNRSLVTASGDVTVIYRYTLCGYTECDTCGQAICDAVNPVPGTYGDGRIRVNNYLDYIEVYYPPEMNRLRVFDSRGGLVCSCSLAAGGPCLVRTGSWSPGIYLLNFSGRNMQACSKKVIVTR